MNINNYYDHIPCFDASLKFWTENSKPQTILPDFYICDEVCLCLYGIAETTVANYLSEIKCHGEKLAAEIKKNILSHEAWDLELKPIFLFDTKETLMNFIDFTNRLSDEQFYTVICEMQLDYNVPWVSGQLLNSETVYDIIDYYEARERND